MSCAAPHRLARFARGQLTGRGHERLAAHVDDCARCRAAVARIREAHGAFAAIAEREAPELRWDRIRAQTYWATGSQPALPAVPTRSRRPWLLAPVAVGALAAAWFALTPRPATQPLGVTAPAVVAAVPDVAPELPGAPIMGVVTLVEGRGEIVTADGATLVGGTAVGAHRVGAGDRLIGDGRLAVQFGAGSTFTVGAGSTLLVERFDERAIELVLTERGRVDVEVSHRGDQQRFAVRAGGRTVEVRGTAFRVERAADAVAVACEHGRVVVSSADAGDTVELGAGQRVALGDAEPLLTRTVESLSVDELAQLAASRAPALARWTDADTVLRTTAALPLLAPSGHAVSIDGVATGTGSLWRRVSPGRHLIESADPRGRVSPGQWIDVGDGPEAPVVIAPAPELPSTGTAAARRARLRELARAIDDVALRGCVRSLAKQGLADGTHVELEIGVSAAGAIRYLNVVDTDLPARVTACVRDVVGQARLGAGAQTSWRHRVSF